MNPPPMPYRIPWPVSPPVGLGQLFKRMTGALGIPPCAACNKRAQALDLWLVFGSDSAPAKPAAQLPPAAETRETPSYGGLDE